MQPVIVQKLRAYRTRIRAWIAAEGVAWIVSAAVALVFLSLAVDYTQRLGAAARVVALAAGLAGIGFVTYRRLLARLLRRMDDERVALTIEDRFPELRDRLISAIQFARAAERGGSEEGRESAAMKASVAASAAEAVGSLDVGRTLDYGRLVRAAGVAAVLSLALVVFGVQDSPTLGFWFRRNVLLSSEAWPQRTHLAVEYQRVVPRGDAMTVTVKAAGEVPSSVTIEYKLLTSGRQGEDDLVRAGSLDENRFEAKFKNVAEPFGFRVSGGDAETDWYEVALVERPAVSQMRFWAVYPAYTRMAAELLPPDQSFLEVLPGTKLDVAAVASKPLQGAWISLDEEDAGAAMVRAVDEKAREFWFAPEERKGVTEFWVGSLQPARDCSVAVSVVDRDGLANRPLARFAVKMAVDKEPRLTIRMRGISEMVVPQAVIPLEIRATDDFGVASLCLKHRFALGEKTSEEETVPFTQPAFGGKEVSHGLVWELEPLGLPPGSVLTFHAEAADYRDVGPRNVGRTESVSVRVVTADELMADLIRRQVEQREDFARIVDRHRTDVKIEIDAAERMAAAGGSLPDDQKERLGVAEQTLRRAVEETRHVADVCEQVMLEMVNNRLGDSEERSKLRAGVVEPLRRLVESRLPELADAARAAAAAQGAELKAGLARLVESDDRALREMDLVLNNMMKLETFRRIVEQAARIREDQREVAKELEVQRKALLDSILNPR